MGYLKRDLTLLFVSDSGQLKKLMNQIFNSFGLNLTHIDDGSKIDQIVSSRIFDIIFIDINISSLDSFKFIKRVKSSNPSQYIIASYSFSDQDSFLKLLKLKVSAFLPKPSDLETIKAVTSKALEDLAQINRGINLNGNGGEVGTEKSNTSLRLKSLEDILESSEILTLIFRKKPEYKLILTSLNDSWFTYSLDQLFIDGFINPKLALNEDYKDQCDQLERFFNNDEKRVEFKVKILNSNNKGICWIKVQYHKSRDIKDPFIKYQVLFFNITEEKKREEKIENLSKIVEQSHSGVAIINEDGFIYYYNKVFYQHFLSSSSITTHNEVLEMIEFENEDDKFEIIDKLYNNMRYRSEIPIIIKNSRRWLRVTLLPLKRDKDSSEKKYAIILNDITEDKLNQLSIKENELNYRRIFSNIHDIYLEFDLDKKVIEVSPSIKDILGYERREVIGNSFIDLFTIEEDYSSFISKLESEKVVNGFETEFRSKSEDVNIMLTGRVSSSINTDKIIYTITARDISEKKRYIKSLIDINEDLVKKHSELKQMQEHLVQQEKMASIGLLAAGIAHEINNPTGYIMSNLTSFNESVEDLIDYFNNESELLEVIESKDLEKIVKKAQMVKNLGNKVDIEFILEDLPELLQESISGAGRIKEIVNNLKNFARNGSADEMLPANINNLLDDSLKLVHNEIKYNSKVVKDYSDLPDIDCYPNKLSQVFTNILVNASHALKDKFDKGMGEIKIETMDNSDSITIKIRDNGNGIPSKYLKNIYDPFFTTKEVGKGTGLGLNISYDIVVNKHSGKLDCETLEGEYTTFIIELPKGE